MAFVDDFKVGIDRAIKIVQEESAHYVHGAGWLRRLSSDPAMHLALIAVWDDALKPSVEMSQRLGLLRFWMHGHLWLNDPDCLIVRTEVTNLTEDETRFLATSVSLSGGLTSLTDDMATLPAARKDHLR